MIYFTSDLHGYHSNICYGTSVWPDKETNCRKYDTVCEMNNAIVDSINSRVKKDDILIHCGDWSFGRPINAWRLRVRLNCANIIHINGNHCNAIRKNHIIFIGEDYLPTPIQKIFSEVHEAPFKFEYCGYNFICSHYPPQHSTDFNISNTIWVHGHSHHKHDNDETHTKHNVIDVGWNGGVYSIDEVIALIKVKSK